MIRNVKDFGAVGDGIHLDTAAIQRAIDAGGTAYFPPGTYLSGTIYLHSNGGLDLDAGAILLGSSNPDDYNKDDFCVQNETCPAEHVSGAHLVVAVEQENIFITGKGRIDGNRRSFTDTPREDMPFLFAYAPWRPSQMIFFCECRNVSISNAGFYNAPYWTILLHGCVNVSVENIRIYNDRRTLNGDGLDIDCCKEVIIRGCFIDTGDDCITLRANSTPLKQKFACEHVIVSDCILRTRCNAMRIGVGDGVIRSCVFNNIICRDTMCGICIVSSYSENNAVEISDLQFNNLYLDAGRAIAVKVWHLGPDAAKAGKPIRNISFNQLQARSKRCSFIGGNPEMKIRNISFSNAEFRISGGEHLREQSEWREMAPIEFMPSALHVENAENISIFNSKVIWDTENPDWKQAVSAVNAANIKITGSDFPDPCNTIKQK